MNPILLYLLVTFLVLLLDFIWIGGIFLPRFTSMIEDVQKEKFVVNTSYAVISYLILITLIFIIIQKCNSWYEAFFIGFLIYAVYDSTNLATLKNWDVTNSTIDSLWGGTLIAIIYAITTAILG